MKGKRKLIDSSRRIKIAGNFHLAAKILIRNCSLCVHVCVHIHACTCVCVFKQICTKSQHPGAISFKNKNHSNFIKASLSNRKLQHGGLHRKTES